MLARTVAAAAVLSIFLSPMAADLGWSRTLISGASSLGGLVASALGPGIGWLADRYGPRVVLAGSMLVLGVSTAALGTVTAPLAFYLAYLVGRAIFACPVPIATTVAVASWFRLRRGRAMAIANACSFAGLVILPLIVQVSIIYSSWRVAWFILGALAWGIALGPTALLLARRPEDLGLKPDGAPNQAESADSPGGAAEPIWSLGEAIRTPTLWALSLAGSFMFAVQAGMSVHQAAHFAAQGMSPLIAASIVSVMALANLVGALLSGFLSERFGSRLLYGLSAAVLAGNMLFLLAVNTPQLAYLYATLFGLAIGSGLTVGPVIFADFYGRESLGSIRGIAEPFVSLGQAAGVLFAGIVFDLTGSYTVAIVIFAGSAAVAALLIALSRPPVKAVTVRPP